MGGHDMNDIPTFSNIEDELADLPGVFSPEHGGALLLAVHEGKSVGCIALIRKDANTSELKRMYVQPSSRGQGVGKRLLSELILRAREFGYEKIILDSHKTMTTAHKLYTDAGFVTYPLPDYFPDFLKLHAIYMELQLD